MARGLRYGDGIREGTVQSLGTESDGLPAEKLIVQTFLYQKRQRALEAFTEALKAKYSVKVYEENL